MIPGMMRFDKLHVVIQAVMGWKDAHLHLFRVAEDDVGISDPDFDLEAIEEQTVKVEDVVVGQRFRYAYDFGGRWDHEILVESIEPVLLVLKRAVCLDGERACTPEDVGGIRGFEEFLLVLSDPDHEEHQHYLSWSGGHFDATLFSAAAANAALQRIF